MTVIGRAEEKQPCKSRARFSLEALCISIKTGNLRLKKKQKQKVKMDAAEEGWDILTFNPWIPLFP